MSTPTTHSAESAELALHEKELVKACVMLEYKAHVKAHKRGENVVKDVARIFPGIE